MNIDEFVKYRMTHNDGLWLIEKLGEDPKNYIPVNISVEVHNREDIVSVAKRHLAERAIALGYLCVSNLDQCGYVPDKHLILEASGWERKSEQ